MHRRVKLVRVCRSTQGKIREHRNFCRSFQALASVSPLASSDRRIILGNAQTLIFHICAVRAMKVARPGLLFLLTTCTCIIRAHTAPTSAPMICRIIWHAYSNTFMLYNVLKRECAIRAVIHRCRRRCSRRCSRGAVVVKPCSR